MEILSIEKKDGMIITDYTSDGVNVVFSESVREDSIPSIEIPTIEQQILYETQYQTTLLEMGGM